MGGFMVLSLVIVYIASPTMLNVGRSYSYTMVTRDLSRKTTRSRGRVVAFHDKYLVTMV